MSWCQRRLRPPGLATAGGTIWTIHKQGLLSPVGRLTSRPHAARSANHIALFLSRRPLGEGREG
eukprot:9158990-Pyramimonas_sp.AAC.1